MYFNPYAIPNLISSVIIFSFGIFVFLRNKFSHLNRAITFWCLAAFIWLFFYFLVYSTKSDSFAVIFSRIACIGVLFLGNTSYDFFVAFLDLKKEKLFVNLAYLCSIVLIPFFFLTDYFILGVNSYYFGFYGKASFLYPFFLAYFFIIILRAFYLVFSKRISRDLSILKINQEKYLRIGFLIAGFGSIDFLPKFGFNVYPCGYIFVLINPKGRIPRPLGVDECKIRPKGVERSSYKEKSATPFRRGYLLWLIIMAYAIFRHNLMDINIVIRKGLVYSVLIAVFTIVYLCIVILIERLFQGIIGYQSIFVSLISASLIAIFFIPLRNGIQRFLDNRFFKGTLESLATERERLKQNLFQTEKLAYVGKMASSVVHEIKSPLTAIKTYVEYLPQKYQDPAFKEKFQNLIPQEIERINKVVHQLLDLAKPRDPSLKTVDLHNIMDTTLSLLENNFQNKSISVRKNYCLDSVCIEGDQEQLQQVFLNLFLNAIEAMLIGGELAISTSLCSSGMNKSVQICVQNNGPCIPNENLDKIFTPFFTTKKEGIGLGLVICKEIVESHKGTIKAQSEKGEGTRFILEFPFG